MNETQAARWIKLNCEEPYAQTYAAAWEEARRQAPQFGATPDYALKVQAGYILCNCTEGNKEDGGCKASRILREFCSWEEDPEAEGDDWGRGVCERSTIEKQQRLANEDSEGWDYEQEMMKEIEE